MYTKFTVSIKNKTKTSFHKHPEYKSSRCGSQSRLFSAGKQWPEPFFSVKSFQSQEKQKFHNVYRSLSRERFDQPNKNIQEPNCVSISIQTGEENNKENTKSKKIFVANHLSEKNLLSRKLSPKENLVCSHKSLNNIITENSENGSFSLKFFKKLFGSNRKTNFRFVRKSGTRKTVSERFEKLQDKRPRRILKII